MGLGIISSDDFEKELADCVSNSNISTPIIPRTIIPRDFDIDSNNVIDSDINEQAPEVIQVSAKARGRGESNTQVPSGIRKIIGETSVINGRSDAIELANMFGISKSSVSAYKEGAHSTSTINEPNKDTKAHIDASKLKVSIRARKKLNLALTHITEDKLLEAKVGEIASVAKSMAGIIKDMEPSNEGSNNKSQMPFIVYAPIVLKESNYEVVHAKDDY